MLFVGIGEELLFRGILQNAMHEYFGEDSLKKLYKAIILSSTLFGMVHLVNVFKGVTFLSAFFQALVAIPVGGDLGQCITDLIRIFGYVLLRMHQLI